MGLKEAVKNLEASGDTDFLEMAKGVLTREESYANATPEPEPKLEGMNYKSLAALGDKVQAQGRFDLALKIFKQAETVAVSPAAKGSAANRQGKVLLDSRRPNESVTHFERAVKYQPNEKVFLNNLGFGYWTLYDSGKGTQQDLKKAVDVFYKVNAIDPSYRSDNFKMALAELTEVDPEAAKAYNVKEEKEESATDNEETPADDNAIPPKNENGGKSAEKTGSGKDAK